MVEHRREKGLSRSLSRVLTTLTLALWPTLAWAGPPQLPAVPGGTMPAPGAEPSAPAQPTPTPTGPALQAQPTIPTVQRPATMLQPAAPSAPSSPADSPAPPAEVGPQPAPPQPVAMGPAPAAPAPDTAADPAPAPSAESSSTAAAPVIDPTPSLGDQGSPEAAVVEEAESPKDRFPHRGVVGDFRIGTLGCIGALCRDGRHDVSPGVRLSGFIGGNIRGWVELGLAGGWGTMKPNVTPGTNALLLYGLNPAVLQQALLAQAAGLIDINFAGLAVDDAKMRALQVGPRLRVHFVPRGRVGAFIGTGVGYNRLRNRYETAAGSMELDFHGIEIPVEANISAYVLPNLAVGVQFDYMWTWYGLAVLDHPDQRAAIPMGVLQAAAQQQDVDLRGDLPQLWTLGLAIRGRV